MLDKAARLATSMASIKISTMGRSTATADFPMLTLCTVMPPLNRKERLLVPPLPAVLHQLDQKIIYPHYDFKHLTEKYFEIGMKLDNFLIQLVKYCSRNEPCDFHRSSLAHFTTLAGGSKQKMEVWFESMVSAF